MISYVNVFAHLSPEVIDKAHGKYSKFENERLILYTFLWAKPSLIEKCKCNTFIKKLLYYYM